jgi:hypothetical protein
MIWGIRIALWDLWDAVDPRHWVIFNSISFKDPRAAELCRQWASTNDE